MGNVTSSPDGVQMQPGAYAIGRAASPGKHKIPNRDVVGEIAQYLGLGRMHVEREINSVMRSTGGQFVQWSGGACPFAPDEAVTVLTSSGRTVSGFSCNWDWEGKDVAGYFVSPGCSENRERIKILESVRERDELSREWESMASGCGEARNGNEGSTRGLSQHEIDTLLGFEPDEEHEPKERACVGKDRWSLLPVDAITEVVRAMETGASKHGAHDWERGLPWSVYFDAAQRHLWAFQGGETADRDSGLHPLAHAAASLLILLAHAKRGIGTDDRRANR